MAAKIPIERVGENHEDRPHGVEERCGEAKQRLFERSEPKLKLMCRSSRLKCSNRS